MVSGVQSAFCKSAHKAVLVATDGVCIESCSLQTVLYTFAKKMCKNILP